MKVSVCMTTYNQERFIAQAIESVLMQEADFDYELVIGEDCSADRTRDVVIDYRRRYPDRIRLLLPERNLGMRVNGRRTREACRGEYIAELEGDDYWTCPHKLRKQVDFMDTHPECPMCFHPAVVVYEGCGGEQQRVGPSHYREMWTAEDLLRDGDFIPTLSMVYVRRMVSALPRWYYDLPVGDMPLKVLLATRGPIGFIGEAMGAYRSHGGGVWTGLPLSKRHTINIEVYSTFRKELSAPYSAFAEQWLRRWLYIFALESERAGDLHAARFYAMQRLRLRLFRPPPEETPAGHLLRLYAPLIHSILSRARGSVERLRTARSKSHE